MSSRRKQSKPKSFGVNESIEDASFKPENASLLTNNANIKSIERSVSSTALPSTLPPIPSTDLLLFNSSNKSTNESISDSPTTSSSNNETCCVDNMNKRKREDEPKLNQSQTQIQQENDKIIISSNDESETQAGEYSMNELAEMNDEEDDAVTNENDLNLEDDYSDELDNQSYDNHINTQTFSNNRLILHLAETGFNTPNSSMSVHFQSQSMSILNSTLNDTINQSGELLQFKCKVCGKGFKHRRSLNRHVRLHSGEKNYKCPHCTTAFARSDHLKAHIRTHNNSKPYRCAVCQCGYNTQAALKVHIAHHHSKSKFKCALCNNMEFHSQLALEGHMYTKHSQANAEIDIETAMISNHHCKLNSLNNQINISNNNHDLNENDFHDSFPNLKSDLITNSSANINLNLQHQQPRVKLADINNYNSKDDSTSNHPMLINNLNNLSNNSENRENRENKSDSSQLDLTLDDLIETNRENNFYDDINDSANNSDAQLHLNQQANVNSTKTNNEDNQMSETATIIDTYGEDDDEENNSDISSSSLVFKHQQNDQDKSIEDQDDIIIEENLSSAKASKSNGSISNQDKLKRLAPKPLPPPPVLGAAGSISNGTLLNKNIQKQLSIPPPLLLPANRNLVVNKINHTPNSANRPLLSSNNTYCEMCNARFSSLESFQSHMRNCHPHVIQQQQQVVPPLLPQSTQQQPQQIPVKMPYLSNILTKTNSSSNLQNGTKSLNEAHPHSGGIIITNNGIIITPASAVSKIANNCTRLNCNCSLSPNKLCTQVNPSPAISVASTVPKKDDDLDYYYAIKETHYKCSQCNLTMYKLNDYMAHLKQEHCVEVYRCILCKQMQLFDNINLLKEHFFQEHQSQKYEYFKCRLCINPVPNSSTSSLLFNSLDDLNNHLKSVHQINASSPPQQQVNKMLISQQISSVINNSLPMPPPPPPPPPPLPVHLSIHMAQQQSLPIYSQYGSTPSQPPPNQYNTYDRFNSYSTNKFFKCNYCDSDFAQQSYLNQHIQMVHSTNKLNNSNTASTSNNINPVLNNNFSTNPQQIFSCQFCRNTFTNRAQFERHVRIHVSSIDLKCNICDKIFESQDLLSQHKLTHCKTFNANSSDVDNKEPKSESNMKVNGTGASGSITDGSVNSSSAVCVYCKQTIDNESVFKEHFKRHNNIGATNTNNGTKANSFICIVCRQTLTSNSEYNLHMRHHLRRITINNTNNNVASQQKSHASNNKSNQQQISISTDKNDQDRANNDTNSHQINGIQQHQTTDNSSKLRCSKCLVKFEVWQELADHIAEFHSQSSPVTTVSKTVALQPTSPPQQQFESSQSASIDQQITIKQELRSPEPISNSQLHLNQDQKKLRIEESVTQFNMLISEIMCEICSSKFDSNTKLQCHLLIKHEFVSSNNVFTCPVCDESFTRAESLIQHTLAHGPAARIYKCTECSLAFVFKSQLINHSFSHHQLQRSSSENQNAKRAQIFSQTNTNFNLNNSNKNAQINQLIRVTSQTRETQPGQPYDQYQQPIQRFRCNECSIDFSSFRFYQHHSQTVHNRTIFSNSNTSSIIG